jgi:hypothetical protein
MRDPLGGAGDADSACAEIASYLVLVGEIKRFDLKKLYIA